MKCQKCGEQMVSGHLYCDKCGAEYQIVPDFEPEIEISIAEGLSGISEALENQTDTLTEEMTGLEPEVKKYKVPAFSTIFFLVFLVFIFLYAAYHNYTTSTEYRINKALEAMNQHDYYNAAQIYKSLRKDNPQEINWYLKEAEVRLLLNQEPEAYNLALQAMELEGNTEKVYEFLLPYLEKQGNYIEMNRLLKDCKYSEIREKYWEFLCELPQINYESGSYDSVLEVKFEEGYEGTVYYTLDRTIPNSESTKYQNPILLGNGTHILTAVYETSFGSLSEPVVFEYEIDTPIPLAPVIIPDSGNYSVAEMIKVDIEEGCRVYYTTDLTQPTQESTEYTKPIPMPIGESQFHFISFSSYGIGSNVTHKKYNLEIKAHISIEDAAVFLMQKLINSGHILNFDGSVQDRYGVFQYSYKYTVSENGKNYYVYEEHYLENQINNPLNEFYAVDVLTGSSYKLIYDNDGNFTRLEI